MYGAVRIDLDCGNQAGALQVKDALDQYIATLPARDVFRSELAVSNKHSSWFVTGELIYGDPLDAQRLYNRAQTIWNTPPYKTIVLAGSDVNWHECHADEGVAFCQILPGNEAIK